MEHRAFSKTLCPTTMKDYHGREHPVHVRVQYDGAEPERRRLSISGVEGARKNGDAWGSCGQITLVPGDARAPWTPAMVERLALLWDRWHLNDMRAGCEHQRATWSPGDQVEVVTYGLSRDGYEVRRVALEEAARAAREGRVAHFGPAQATEAARFLIGPDWFRDRHEAPDADSPLSGLYEVKKRETMPAGSTTPDRHPRGLLGKPCEVCGYKYGTSWLYEPVPAEVLAELLAFPDADVPCAWGNL